MADSLQPTSRSDHYKLVGVKVTDKTLGSGPYTSDVELDYVGLKCVGKKIHQALFMQGETTAKVRQLKEQCHLLSQLRHPNIAMFLGLFFQQSPILVMEYIPYDLASCIEQYGELPNEVSYSVLHDVAVGLNYLHSHTPAIIHGELSASTILLTPNMRAKISYLGVSKILRLTQPEIQYMAKTSGTLAYMAPEIKTITVLQYDSSIDSYSYGILVIHIFTGKPPDLHPNTEPFNSNTHSETATGYEMLLNADNPLKELTLRCTNESPQMRPQPEELEIVLADTVKMFPATFINRIEMMIEITRNHRAKQNGNDKAILEEKVQHTKQVVRTQQQEIEKLIIENEIFRKQLDSDKELFSKVVKDLQQSLNSEQSSDTECLQEVAPDTQEVKHHDSKPITLPRKMINRALPRSPIQQRRKNTEKRPHLENVTVKMFGPKPIIPPRKNAPPKENQANSSPKIEERDKKRANSSATTSTTNTITETKPRTEKEEIQLVTMIGKGRFFEVWDGHWKSMRVAVKKLTEQFTPAVNIEDEIAIMKSLCHPNLVQVYAASTAVKPMCLLMELIEGGSLLDYLRTEGKTLQFAQLIEKAEQIAAGMAYLEQQNYVHQNLSARNVMLGKDLVCKVSDYGVVRLIRAIDKECSVPTSLPKRTAPEAFLNGQFTIKSDVWSYGILLYELVTYGHLPYVGLSPDQIMKQLQEGYRTPCPENCQEKLYEIMLSCWKKDPESRPTFETLRWQMEDFFSTDDDGYLYMKGKRTSLV